MKNNVLKYSYTTLNAVQAYHPLQHIIKANSDHFPSNGPSDCIFQSYIF